MKNHKFSTIIIYVFLVFIFIGCGESTTMDKSNNQLTIQTEQPNQQVQVPEKENYKVTFIELGSVRCIPCQKMQPIMKSIEEKYSKDVKVIFYDVWTPLGKPMAAKYNINLIPTQVFLDENGKEFFRHEGFFPEEELVKVLKSKGVTEH